MGHVVQQDGVPLVCHEHLAETFGCGLVVDEDVALEIVLERTEVDVRGATGAE